MSDQSAEPRAVEPAVLRWARSAALLCLRTPSMIAVVVVAAGLHYGLLRLLGLSFGVAGAPLAVFLCAALAARTDGRDHMPFVREVRYAALCSVPLLVFASCVLAISAMHGEPLPVTTYFDGLTSGLALFLALHFFFASSSVWTYLQLVLEGRTFRSARERTDAGRKMNFAWSFLLIVVASFVVSGLSLVPILTLPFAAFLGALEYVIFREVFWGIHDDASVDVAVSKPGPLARGAL